MAGPRDPERALRSCGRGFRWQGGVSGCGGGGQAELHNCRAKPFQHWHRGTAFATAIHQKDNQEPSGELDSCVSTELRQLKVCVTY